MENLAPLVLLLAFVGGPILYFVVKGRFRKKREERFRKAANLQALMSLAEGVQRDVEKINSLKTPASRVTRCKAALAKLRDMNDFEECRQVVSNYDELKAQLRAMIKVFPVIDKVEKAYKNRFKGKDNMEKNALLDALYEIQTNEVTNEDFLTAQIMPEGTGEIVQIEGIVDRLKELGWEGPGDGSKIPV